jgi:uncharacterized RDD family membrane protein YckC
MQATIGKRLLGMRVTDTSCRRISFMRATLRHFAKWLSAAILFLGFLMVTFTERRQGLHDVIATTFGGQITVRRVRGLGLRHRSHPTASKDGTSRRSTRPDDPNRD